LVLKNDRRWLNITDRYPKISNGGAMNVLMRLRMITIKKYPNRRLYNTQTSTYINLDGIQSLIQQGTVVCILDSKTGEDVTTATLLHHVFDPSVLQKLVPGNWMQRLMQMSSNEKRVEAIDANSTQSITELYTDLDLEPESETQADERTQPKIDKQDILSAYRDESSESSESEVTMVRIEEPPTIETTVKLNTVSQHTGMEADSLNLMNEERSGRLNGLETIDSSDQVLDPLDSDVEIPSFWSEQDVVSVVSVLQQESEDESEGENQDESIELSDGFYSEEDLFTQPETIVVRQMEDVPSGNVAPEIVQASATVDVLESISDASVSFELYSQEEFVSKVEILKNSEDMDASEESNTIEKSEVLDGIEDVVLSFEKDSLDEYFCEVVEPEAVGESRGEQSVLEIDNSMETNVSISIDPTAENVAESVAAKESVSESSSDAEESSSEDGGESSSSSSSSVSEGKPTGDSSTVISPSSPVSPSPSVEPLSKSEQMQARLEAMKASLRR
jgi:polyhydroxyalkanoate synthesis repressor PhaR